METLTGTVFRDTENSDTTHLEVSRVFTSLRLSTNVQARTVNSSSFLPHYFYTEPHLSSTL